MTLINYTGCIEFIQIRCFLHLNEQKLSALCDFHQVMKIEGGQKFRPFFNIL